MTGKEIIRKEFLEYSWEPLKEDVDFERDTERLNADLGYCGTCSYVLGDETRQCEQCDFEFKGCNEGENGMSLKFHKDCPCYCYICNECEGNVLELSKEDDEECEDGNHGEKRRDLLKRLGIVDNNETEKYYYVEVNQNEKDKYNLKETETCVYDGNLIWDEKFVDKKKGYLFYPHSSREDFSFSERFIVCEDHYNKAEKIPNYDLWEFREGYLRDDNKDWKEKEIEMLIDSFHKGEQFIVEAKRGHE